MIDIDKRLDDINLGVLDAADTMFVVMTADLSCLKNVRLVLETIGHLGYEAAKVQLVLNRSNAFTGINVKNAEGALKRNDRLPDRQRVPRRDQRPELGRAVHVHEGRLAARPVAARLRPDGRQGAGGRGGRAGRDAREAARALALTPRRGRAAAAPRARRWPGPPGRGERPVKSACIAG